MTCLRSDRNWRKQDSKSVSLNLEPSFLTLKTVSSKGLCINGCTQDDFRWCHKVHLEKKTFHYEKFQRYIQEEKIV